MCKHLSNSTHFLKYRNEIPYRSSSILISIAMKMTLSDGVVFKVGVRIVFPGILRHRKYLNLASLEPIFVGIYMHFLGK